MEQQFSLTWKNFHGNLSGGFSDLLGNGEFVDVTLACEGHLLQAHKVVLSICSPYFKRMFQLNPCQHPIVVLRDISHCAMKDLIHFMYNGEVNVRQEDLAGFINTAETLQIKGLTNKHTDEEKREEVPAKVASPKIPVTTNITNVPESNPDSTNTFTDDLSHMLDNTQSQIDLFNSLRLAALKRKSEEFLANNFNLALNEKNHQLPEKRIKIREKHILNRHKVGNNYIRPASTESYDGKQIRNEGVPTSVVTFNEHAVNNTAKLTEKTNLLIENKAHQDINGRPAAIVEDIKQEKEEECDVVFDDQPAPKTINGTDTEGSLDMTTSRLEQEDGARATVETPPTILRASWPISQQNRKSTSSPGNVTTATNRPTTPAKASPNKNATANNQFPSPGQILSNIQSSLAHLPSLNSGQSQHTIITIPQKEDGKKKYPQRSCKFCWRKAGKRRDTRFMCMECCVPLCKTNCFEMHQSEGFLMNFKDDTTTAVL